MEFLSKEATGFECNVASLSSPATEWQTVHPFSNYPPSFQALIISRLHLTATVLVLLPWSIRWMWKYGKSTLMLQNRDIQVCKTDCRHPCFHRQLGQQKAKELWLLMVDYFHVAILLNPKLTDNDIVHTTCGVCPGVGLTVPMEKNAYG